MAEGIDLERLRELIDHGAQLVEVLPDEEYAWGHLPGAIGLPLTRLDRTATEGLDHGREVVVYCWDAL